MQTLTDMMSQMPDNMQSTVGVTVCNVGVPLYSKLNFSTPRPGTVSKPVTTICEVSSKLSVVSTVTSARFRYLVP